VLFYLLALSPIALAVLPWSDFQGHTHWNKVAWIPFFSPPIRVRDIVANVLLFCPLGATVGVHSRARNVPLHAALVAVTVSLLAEWSQLYSHTRFPSATDLVCNAAGSMLAAAFVIRRHARAAAAS